MPCETGKTRLMVPDKTLTILPPALEGEAGALTELFHIYEAAMKVIAVRLEILDAEFKNLHDHNPIHHTEARVKSLDSILQKLERKGLDPTIENIQHYITDVAGLRIVCPYVDDIYLLDNCSPSRSTSSSSAAATISSTPSPTATAVCTSSCGCRCPWPTGRPMLRWRFSCAPLPWICGPAWSTSSTTIPVPAGGAPVRAAQAVR